jgi:hypothetical protein
LPFYTLSALESSKNSKFMLQFIHIALPLIYIPALWHDKTGSEVGKGAIGFT